MSSGSPQSSNGRTTPSRRVSRQSAATASVKSDVDAANNGHFSYVSGSADDKQASRFTSSLSIAVEGTVPIEKPGENRSAALTSALHSLPPDARRTSRKSKTDALIALARSRSPSLDEEKPVVTEIGKPALTLNAAPIPVSASLDMKKVKTTAPKNAPSRSKTRMFELEDCPIYHPSQEEFKDPLKYIQSISPEAQHYGIIKIVPPEGWNMPFVTDTETYRFTTRAMRLNSVEASSRAKINFYEALYRFHRQQGNPNVKVPTVNHKALDLWLLRKEVDKLGGFETVNKGKKWADLGRLLGYGGIPGLSQQLRNSYIRVILPYEELSKGVRNSPNLSSGKQRETQTPPPISTRSESHAVSSSLGSPLSVTSSPLSEPPDDGEINGTANGTSKSRMNGVRHKMNGKLENGMKRARSPDNLHGDGSKGDKQEASCEVCHRRNRDAEMLLCDGCDCGFHMFCLVPPLTSIPKGLWFCHTCLFGTGGDFGFDEGEEHSLSTFQARDEAFRKMWFVAHPPPQPKEPLKKEDDDPTVNILGNVRVTEQDVEKEFWRLVQSPNETVEIEYGADVHSTTHGSAMPTLETHPLDPYSKDPWNLNNIPILPDSLLRYIKSEISGMTVPWTYVGMIFSTFCWHNEDHYTHSINYMHWGETKTWYGIPGEDAEKFEAAIKKEAPELFETQPDLLFQLVTLMSPARLREAGVRVYACDQRAGEFVVTFPKAYHAGFNHGLNFNEAVNFALPDWLPLGRQCVKRYQEHKKLPVFSQDELLITISQQSHSIRTAIWLSDSFKEMVEQELEGRKMVRTSEGLSEILEEHDHPEEQYQCTKCKAFCYLSQIICTCPHGGVGCLEHIKDGCVCKGTQQRILRLRFSDSELSGLQSTIETRAAIPNNWRNKLTKLLNESAKPGLRHLRALVAEADRINYPLKQLSAVRNCVIRANEWIELANSFLTRKQSRKRSKRHRWQPSLANGAGVSDDVTERPEKSLDELYSALKEVENLGFDCPEIGQLRDLATRAEEFKKKADNLLKTVEEKGGSSSHLQDCEALLAHGSSLNVHLEELYKIENIVLQSHLTKELAEIDEGAITLDEIRQFLSRAKACDMPSDNEYMKLLETKLKTGSDWDERATNVLVKPNKTIEELNQFFDVEQSIPVDPTVLNRIQIIRARALELERQAKAWLAPEPGVVLPNVQDALRLIQRAEPEFNIPAIHDLKRTADFASDLEERCQAVLKNRYEHRDEGSVFDAMNKWRNYAQEHLTKFKLPAFDKLNAELELHELWLKKLPWYCADHEEPHGGPILKDVRDYTKLEEDGPPEDEFFTCICFEPVRPPPPGQMSSAVQCDHCFARFHGRCASNGGSCPFCDPNHWNGKIHNERNYHFCYLPTVLHNAPDVTKAHSQYWKDLKEIVDRIQRLCDVIGRLLSFASQPGNQHPEHIPQVRHYMRKLYKIQFAVSPNPEVSFGLDLAGLHRILAGRPPPVRVKKRRRPRFTFGQDVDKEWVDGTRCICRGQTAYLQGYAVLSCDTCQRRYHNACICYKGPVESDKVQFTCPLCCLRKGRAYRWADIRVRTQDETNPQIFVDVRACIETYSRELIRIKLDPPSSPTIFVDLVSWIPGQPENVIPSGELSFSNGSPSTGRLAGPGRQGLSALNGSSASGNVPPPPPWSRSESRANQSPGPTAPADAHASHRRKRKHSHLTDADNVLVFEVDPGQPPTGPPTTHRSVHQHAKSEISFIMHDPSNAARAKPLSSEPLQAPFQPGQSSRNGEQLPHPDARPHRSHSTSEWTSPGGRTNGVTHSPHAHNRTPVQNVIHSPQQRPLLPSMSHSPQQRHFTHGGPLSPRQLATRLGPLSTPPHTHSATHSPQQRHQTYNTSVRSPTIQTTPHRHSVSSSPVLPPLHKALGSPIASGLPAPRIDSPSRERLPITSPHSERKVRLVVRDEPSPYIGREPSDVQMK